MLSKKAYIKKHGIEKYNLMRKEKNIKLKLWRERNKDSLQIKRNEYYKKNKEAIALTNKKTKIKNKVNIKIYAAKYRANNKEKTAEYDKMYRIKNIEAIKKRQKKYSKTTKGKVAKKRSNKKSANRLSDGYIRSRLYSNSLNLAAKDIPQELIELKRIQLKLYRELKKSN